MSSAEKVGYARKHKDENADILIRIDRDWKICINRSRIGMRNTTKKKSMNR